MSWPSSMKLLPIAIDQQTQLVSMWVVGMIKPDVEVTNNIDSRMQSEKRRNNAKHVESADML